MSCLPSIRRVICQQRMPMNIQLVIFDLGRVLIRIHDDWVSAARAVGVTWTEAHAKCMLESRERLANINHAHERGEVSDDHFVAEVAASLSMPEAAVRHGMTEWIIEPYAGIHELIADVKATGRKVACLSNTNANHWAQMDDPTHPKYVGTREMDWAFASQNLNARKPESAIYESVESITGIEAKHILFFDDLEANLAAARSRGWNTFRVDPTMEPGPQVRQYLKQIGILT